MSIAEFIANIVLILFIIGGLGYLGYRFVYRPLQNWPWAQIWEYGRWVLLLVAILAVANMVKNHGLASSWLMDILVGAGVVGGAFFCHYLMRRGILRYVLWSAGIIAVYLFIRHSDLSWPDPGPEPAVEFPGEIQGAVPMSFGGRKFLEVNPNQVVIVNTEGGVIVRQEGFDILDNLPQNQKFPQGKIWYWVDLKDVAPYSGSAKYLDPWDSKKKADEFKLKSGNAIVGYRVRGSEPKKLAIFIPLNKD